MRMMERKLGGFILVVALLSLLSAAAYATTVIHFDWNQLVARSPLIATGEVQDSVSHWNADKTKIYTTSTIRVESVLKGQSASTIQIRQLGGTVDGIGSRLMGAPVFTPGEDVVVFLEARPDGAYVPVGLNQGKCQLIKKRDGQSFVRRELDVPGVRLVKTNTLQTEEPTTLKLEELMMIIKQQQAE